MIIQTDFYTYYHEKILVKGFIPYKRFKYYHRKDNRNKRNHFIKLWINSICFIYWYLSIQDLYWFIKCLGVNDFDDQYILDCLKYYKQNKNQIIKDDKEFFKVYTHYEWNKELLYKTFGNKEAVNKYKQSIRNKNSRMEYSDKKTNLIINYYENNRSLSKQDFINRIKKEVSVPTINKTLKEHNIQLSNISKSTIIIENKLFELFTYRIDKVTSKMTYSLLSEYCGVSLRTFNRFIKENERYKVDIENFNKKFIKNN